jgi:hypothetical protein
MASEAHQVSHQLAAKAATEFVKAAAEAGLSWADIAIGGETIVAIIVAATAKARAGHVYQQMIRERENAKAVEAVLREFNHHAGSMAQVIVYLRGQRKEQTT